MRKLLEFNQGVRSSKKMPDIKAGDIVRVHRKIKEGDKERIQIFEGIVMAVKGKQSSSPMVTVRKVSFGVGVEIIVPVYSPSVEKIEVIRRARVRRSKLYYLRKKGVQISKLKTKELDNFAASKEEQEPKDKAQEESGEEKNENEKVKKETSAEKDAS